MILGREKTLIAFVFALIFSPAIDLMAQAGGSSVPFLLITPDARASGRGETGTAIADDANAIYWNTGGLGFLDYAEQPTEDDPEGIPYRQVALSFSPWLPQFNADLFYSYITGALHLDDLDGTVAFNFIFMNLGEFTRTDINGKVLGKFISNEFNLGISYGTIVAPDLGVGFQLKYIQSNLTPTSASTGGEAGTGISAGFDLGVLWKPQDLDLFGWEIGNAFSVGMNLQNVGPKITYIKESDPLPTTLKFGTAFKLVQDEFNDLVFAVDFAKLLVKRDENGSDPLPKSLVTAWQNPGAEWSFGLEYYYEKIIALRAGYFTEPAVLGNRQYWNFGAGVHYDMFKLDFSFINTVEQNHPLANTMRFSMLIDL